jgi:DNA repair exonuclease SbcCD ATPase subunit
LDNEVRELQVKQSLVDIELGNLNTQLSEYSKKGLLGQTNCPTCGGVLEDISQYLTHIQLKISQTQASSQDYQRSRVALTNDLNVLRAKKSKADEYIKNTQELQNKLEALGACDFDQGTYDLYTAVAAQYYKLQTEHSEAEKCSSKFDRDILHSNMELVKLPEYDKAKKDMFVEKAELDELLQTSAAQADKKLELLQKTAVLRKSLELASEEIAKNKTLRDKNMRRKNYVAVLQAIYDMFATAQFPRKLIQTYTDTVSAYLVENLRRFNFPYTVKVNGSFGIDVFDEKERLLPSVSGGQEIMIGIALRLALHSMFGAAFPMLILDEGSVHLSQESKKSYFQIIQELKKASNLKQIIIIDHDEELASVVDNTIKLN